jgi:starch-binding outer membrane protein, SusD/RagB family
MKKIHYLIIGLCLFTLSCDETLDPEPVDILVDDLALNEPNDVANVEIGLYSAFRSFTSDIVIAGDLTADNLIHNGTFTQYREIGVKKITSSNASAASLWGGIYYTIYIANFILEKLPDLGGVPTAQRQRVLATAHFLRGYAYFTALYTFGGVPQVTTTDFETNKNIARATKEEILTLITNDYNQAVNVLPAETTNPGFASSYAVRAAIAKLSLYTGNWAQAESYASQVISSGNYTLEPKFADVVATDFSNESIFEMGYTIADDPGTLNTLFQGRREIIPSNEEILALASNESGDRFSSISFETSDLNGSDNGWSVAKYGTAVNDNNNIVIFRLAEMYLIRAEARAQQSKVTGVNSAQEDINVLRARANAPLITSASQNQMILLIENERRYELAFEGHRWYDLVRTNRVSQVMPVFNSNWNDTYNVWPIPQREIQNNPALLGNQNPGY